MKGGCVMDVEEIGGMQYNKVKDGVGSIVQQFPGGSPSLRVAQSADVAIKGKTMTTASSPKIFAIPNPDSSLTICWSWGTN